MRKLIRKYCKMLPSFIPISFNFMMMKFFTFLERLQIFGKRKILCKSSYSVTCTIIVTEFVILSTRPLLTSRKLLNFKLWLEKTSVISSIGCSTWSNVENCIRKISTRPIFQFLKCLYIYNRKWPFNIYCNRIMHLP